MPGLLSNGVGVRPFSGQDAKAASGRKRAGMQAEQEQEQAVFLIDEAQLREEI